jgi:uncharacterized repeat protein (TIGR04042 family)
MPEMTFRVRWPDGTEASCYSPSLVMHDHLAIGAEYSLADFVIRSTTALQQQDEILAAAAAFDGGTVRVLAMHPPLPVEEVVA